MLLQFPQFSKKHMVTLKVLMMLLGISFISYALYFALLAFSFFGESFFMVLSIISACLAVVFCALFLFWENNKKHFKILFAVFTAIVVLSAGIIIVCKNYRSSIPKVLAANGVDLTSYVPFHGAKVASLGKPASLIIEKDFPVMDGATALYPVYAAFAQAIFPELQNEEPSVTRNRYIVCNNTDYAYTDLIRGAADIIFAAEPSQKQMQEAKQAGKEFKLTPIGREAFIFFVSKKNPVNSLTLQQIKDIYAGKITNWKQAGGKHGKIKAFQRPENSGSQKALEELMKGSAVMAPLKERVIEGRGVPAEEVADYRNFKNALGFTFSFFLHGAAADDSRIKVLKINGVAPTDENVINGSYPLVSDFYAVTAGNESKNTEKVIKWILSAEGQELVEKSGYVPIQGQIKGNR